MKQYNNIHWKATSEETYILNLSEGFSPICPSKNFYSLKYKRLEFPGGETQIQILDKVYGEELIITHRVNSPKEFFDILLANDAARRMGFKNIRLIIPYFPAARQDRVCNEGEPLTVKIYTDLINSCGFSDVYIFCPHSEVTPALLNNVTVIDELKYVQKVFEITTNGHHYNLVCPDAGAGKRVSKIGEHLSKRNGFVNINLIRCEKDRDVKTGALNGFFVQTDDLGGYPTLICDDINCRGGTFIGLSKQLREKNCGKLYLFTAHSDCEEGIKNVSEHFDGVFTTNSKRDYTETETFKLLKFEL